MIRKAAHLLCPFLLFVLVPQIFAQAGGQTEPGKPAPPLSIEKWIEPPNGVGGWREQRGRVVVLEFWATWCGPCVAAIPHWNELVRKMEGRPVVFVSITDEGEAVVQKFLAKRPIAGWIALDTDRSMFKDYGVEGIPHTVVVDASGNVLVVTRPELVTEGALKEIFEGNVAAVRSKLAWKPPPVSEVIRGIRNAPDSRSQLLDVVIRAARGPAVTSLMVWPNQFAAEGLALREALAQAYDFPSPRIVMPDWLAETRYDFVITVPKEGAASLRHVFQVALEAALDLRVRRETRNVDVFALVAPHGRTIALKEAASAARQTRLEKNRIRGVGASLGDLARMLERVLGRPVLDEAALTGKYDFELRWDASKPDSVTEAVRDQLGLELRAARRPVELLVVEAADSPSKH